MAVTSTSIRDLDPVAELVLDDETGEASLVMIARWEHDLAPQDIYEKASTATPGGFLIIFTSMPHAVASRISRLIEG